MDRKGEVYGITGSRLFTESYTYDRLLGKYYRDRIPVTVLLRQDGHSPDTRILSVSAQENAAALGARIPWIFPGMKGSPAAFPVPIPGGILPEGLGKIGACAFSGSSVRRVELPQSLHAIGAEAFSMCWYLEEIELPDALTEMGESAFRSCYALEKLRIPGTLTEVPAYAFSGCSGMTDLWIPDSVEQIEDPASVFYRQWDSLEGCRYGFTIHFSPGSPAEQYAEANHISLITEE